MLDQLRTDLQSVAQGIVEQAQVERGSRWIKALEVEHPAVYRLLMAFLDKEPKDVMASLCAMWPDLKELRRNKHVLKYIGLLQQELRGNK